MSAPDNAISDIDIEPAGSTLAASHWSVRTFLIWLVLACLLPGVIGAVILFVYEYREGRAQLESVTRQTVRNLSQLVDSHLLRAQAVAQTLASSDSLANGDLAMFHQRARQVDSLTGLGTNVMLRDEAGHQLLNTLVDFGKPLPSQSAPEPASPVFRTGLPYISDLFIGPVLQRPIVTVDVPVMRGGKVVYALGVGIDTQYFSSILNAHGLPADWVAGIFDSGGKVVARSRYAGKFVGHQATAPLFAAMQQTPEGSIELTTREGIPALTFFSRSPSTGWRVAVALPNHALEAGLVRSLVMLASGMLTLFVIGLFLARSMGRRIAHSVQALTAPAMALASGGPVPVPRVHIREAAEVAAAIGRVADLLQERAATLKAREEELAEAHRLAKFGTWYWDLQTGEIPTSESVREIFGGTLPPFQEMRGTMLPVDSWEQVKAAAEEVVRTGKGYELELKVRRGKDQFIWVSTRCEAVRNAASEVVALRGTLQDITERKQAEERLREAALHDPLTGLPNRALVFEYCQRLVAAALRNHGRGALLFIDLNRFKPINDLHGHETGDRLLQEVAKRLAACTRHEDLVGRLGGDEFVIVLPYGQADRHRAAVVAQHVIDTLSLPFSIGALELSISPATGISTYPGHATDVGVLVHTADLAMYQAKQSGRGSFQFYTPEMDRRADEALSVEARLKNALRQNKLTLHYQPVIDLGTGQVLSAEALVRLADGGDPIGPASFIPIAEATGLIGEVGEWVIAEACRQHAAWNSQGLALTIAVNVSPLQFRQRGFANRLCGIISEADIDPHCLEIEVTESAVMDSVDDAIEILKRIKTLGIRVALDDFGTGYSSLSSLPLDKLKVDQSFVRRIERDPACRTVTGAIIALGRSMRLDIVGEGIESAYAVDYLRQHGCDQAQGYWFSQPLAPLEFAHWYRHQARGRLVAGDA